MRLILLEVARKTGWEIEACKSLAEAEKILGLPGKRLDLVVTASTLPGGSYAEVVDHLRGRDEMEILPIVLFTSSQDDEHAAQAMEIGITEIFHKNNLDAFEIYLESFHEDDPVDLNGKRVLVLEDEKSSGDYLCALLKEQGLQAELSQNADQALSGALINRYDLILSDLVLGQRQSGVGFIRLLRQSTGQSAVAPIIAISGFEDDARRIEALRAGADAFLAKPILVSELLFHVQRLLRRASPAEVETTIDISLSSTLTEREQLICGLTVAGHRDKLIARQLGISYWTVRSHLSHIFQKCGVKNRIELAAKLRHRGGRVTGKTTDANHVAEAQSAVMDWLALSSHALNEIPLGIMVTDKTGRIQMVNNEFTRITGYQSEEVLGNTPRLLKSGHHDGDFYQNIFAALDNKGSWTGKITNRSKAGTLFVEWLEIRRLPPEMPMGAHYIAMIRDISSQPREIENLPHLVLHDPLTGLANRVLLKDRATLEISRARRHGKRLAVAYIDLNNFGAINDMKGHGVGDQILLEVARRLSGSLRNNDTVAREGNDEFIVLLSEVENIHVARSLGEKLLAIFQRPITIDDENAIPIQACVGISLYPDDGGQFEELVKLADKAMDRAKQSGTSCACLFDPALDQQQKH